jgi:hypothetical protein
MNADGLCRCIHLRGSAFIGGSIFDLFKMLVFLRRQQVSLEGVK